jgi:RNA polymerase sigma factor (sigma-70 family)
VGAHDTYLANRPLIERGLAIVCRRHRLSEADAEDFCSTFRLRLMEDNYAMIRAYQGRSSLQTFLVTVIAHFFQDWRNAQWGKWRPSSEAKRLGPIAIQLETLTVRDRLTLDEAYETLRVKHGVTGTRSDLERLAARLPNRTNRTFVGHEGLEQLVDTHAEPERAVHDREAADVARRAGPALATALQSLAAQDRLILKLRFADGVRIVDIARALGLDQKGLYRHIDRLLAQLRLELERQGLNAGMLFDAMHFQGFDLQFDHDALETPDDVRPIDRGARSPISSSGGAS